MKPKDPKYKYEFVMLIDDNELDNFMNESLIGVSLFAEKVYVNSSGVSALEFLKNLAVSGLKPEVSYPEVIFIDINMPIMDGFQFIEKLNAIEGNKFAASKLVILTSSVYSEDREKAENLSGNIMFFNKPLTEEMLKQI
jgi:CheY-like chemotaxis protein